MRRSIVGTRKDLAESIEFAMESKVKATVQTAKLKDINAVFDKMRAGTIEGRVVMEIGTASH